MACLGIRAGFGGNRGQLTVFVLKADLDSKREIQHLLESRPSEGKAGLKETSFAREREVVELGGRAALRGILFGNTAREGDV